MALRLLWQTCRRSASKSIDSPRRLSSHGPRSSGTRFSVYPHLRQAGLISSGLLAATLLYAHTQTPLLADTDDGQKNQRKGTPLSSLVRSYVVYTACSVPALVDWSPQILSTLLSIPILGHATEFVVRKTFFDQFVGGDTAHATLPVLEKLREENTGCLFAYSVEVDEAEAAGKVTQIEKEPVHKRIVQEMIRCIEVAGDFEDNHLHAAASGKGRRTWVAIKLTALLPNAHALHRLSRYITQTRPQSSIHVAFPGCPHNTDLDVLSSHLSTSETGLTEAEVAELLDLHTDLTRICSKAAERGVRVIIDAEHSWYTPAIDAFTLSLMRRFNKFDSRNIQPLVYGTFQAYLRRTPEYLAQSFKDAKDGGYSLGVKLVRGAYHPLEMAAHETRLRSSSSSGNEQRTTSLSISSEDLPPVWLTKSETDACYNECIQVLLDNVVSDIKVPKSQTKRLSESAWSFFTRKSIRDDTLSTTSDFQASPSPRLGILFGSHNWDSCKLILDSLLLKGLANVEGQTQDGEAIVRIGDEVTERVTMAQLYGMADALTNYITDRTRSSTPVVLKYVPYGALVEVMPYLSRRAIENKSVLGSGGAAEERRRALSEIKKQILG